MNIHFSVGFDAQNTHFSIEKWCKKRTFQIIPLVLHLKEAHERGVIAQKCIHHKPCAEAEAGDESVQLGFAHEFGVGVAEAKEQRLVFAGELLGELFLQVVQSIGGLSIKRCKEDSVE